MEPAEIEIGIGIGSLSSRFDNGFDSDTDGHDSSV